VVDAFIVNVVLLFRQYIIMIRLITLSYLLSPLTGRYETMQLPELSFRDISYMLAVAEHLHFGRAAEACAVSQPALSKQIAQLEQQLGITLFERTKRSVKLTPIGHALIEQAKAVWQSGIRLLDVVEQQGPFNTAAWRVGIIASVCPYILPLMMRTVRQQFPQLSLQEGLTHHLITALKLGELDMVWAAATVDDPLLYAIPFYWEPFYLATMNSIWSTKKLYPPYTMDPNTLILLDDGHCLTDQTLGLCGVQSRVSSVKAQQLDTVIHMAAIGLGNAVVPALAAKVHLTSELQFIPFAKEGRQLVLYTRRTSASGQQLAHTFVKQWASQLDTEASKTF
jgi:LysR family transcriptional regulator, hydrogen peroxide-inducible genes activator